MNFLKSNAGSLLFVLFALIGLFTNPFYGISWDEFFMRDMGRVTYEYIFQNSKEFLTYDGRDYGMAIELPLFMMEKIFHVSTLHDIYYLRHFLTHLLFLYGAFCCYKLVLFHYQKIWLAITGFLLVVLNPIIYGHSFFNTKDIPLLAVFFICFYWFAKAFASQKRSHFIILGLFLGYMINIRIAGFVLASSAIGFLFLDLLVESRKMRSLNKNILNNFLLLTASFVLMAFVMWPLVWNDTFENIQFVFKRMSSFRWDGAVLLGGKFYDSHNMPWFYFFWCFGVTNPLVYVILGTISLLILVYKLLRSPFTFLLNGPERSLTLYLLCFTGPLVLIILLHSVIFDNWRHVYFLYAPFVLILIHGIDQLNKTKLKWLINVSIISSFLFVVIFTIINFPHQHVYYNNLVSHETDFLRKNYERDYWGTSYKQALEYILNTDQRDSIRVGVANSPGTINRLALDHPKKGKIIECWMGEADYFITEYRRHPQEYEEYNGKKVFSIRVQNSEIIAVFKLRP